MWWINNVLENNVFFLVATFFNTILILFHVQPFTVKEHPEIALHNCEHENYNGSTLFRKIFQLQRLILFIHVRQRS
jgi:hypothetical protein